MLLRAPEFLRATLGFVGLRIIAGGQKGGNLNFGKPSSQGKVFLFVVGVGGVHGVVSGVGVVGGPGFVSVVSI